MAVPKKKRYVNACTVLKKVVSRRQEILTILPSNYYTPIEVFSEAAIESVKLDPMVWWQGNLYQRAVLRTNLRASLVEQHLAFRTKNLPMLTNVEAVIGQESSLHPKEIFSEISPEEADACIETFFALPNLRIFYLPLIPPFRMPINPLRIFYLQHIWQALTYDSLALVRTTPFRASLANNSCGKPSSPNVGKPSSMRQRRQRLGWLVTPTSAIASKTKVSRGLTPWQTAYFWDRSLACFSISLNSSTTEPDSEDNVWQPDETARLRHDIFTKITLQACFTFLHQGQPVEDLQRRVITLCTRLIPRQAGLIILLWDHVPLMVKLLIFLILLIPYACLYFILFIEALLYFILTLIWTLWLQRLPQQNSKLFWVGVYTLSLTKLRALVYNQYTYITSTWGVRVVQKAYTQLIAIIANFPILASASADFQHFSHDLRKASSLAYLIMTKPVLSGVLTCEWVLGITSLGLVSEEAEPMQQAFSPYGPYSGVEVVDDSDEDSTLCSALLELIVGSVEFCNLPFRFFEIGSEPARQLSHYAQVYTWVDYSSWVSWTSLSSGRCFSKPHVAGGLKLLAAYSSITCPDDAEAENAYDATYGINVEEPEWISDDIGGVLGPWAVYQCDVIPWMEHEVYKLKFDQVSRSLIFNGWLRFTAAPAEISKASPILSTLPLFISHTNYIYGLREYSEHPSPQPTLNNYDPTNVTLVSLTILPSLKSSQL